VPGGPAHMACGAIVAMRSLSGALRFGHPEGAARPDRGGRGLGDGPGRRVRRGCQHHEASGHQAPQRADRHPGPARGSGAHRGRLGPPPGVRPRQGGRVQAAAAAFRARGHAPERGGPPATGRGFRGARPRAAPSRRAPGRCRAPRARCWRTLSPGTRTGAEPDHRVLAPRPARHSPRRPRAGVCGSTRRSLAAGDLGPVCAGIIWIPGCPRTGGSALAAPLPARDAPRGTGLGATGPGRSAGTATHAARRAGAPRLRRLSRSGCSASPARL